MRIDSPCIFFWEGDQLKLKKSPWPLWIIVGWAWLHWLVVQCAHLEKWWISSMGRMTSLFYYGTSSKCLKPPSSHKLWLPNIWKKKNCSKPPTSHMSFKHQLLEINQSASSFGNFTNTLFLGVQSENTLSELSRGDGSCVELWLGHSRHSIWNNVPGLVN